MEGTAAGGREGVVLLHGIMRTSRSLSRLAARLAVDGFEVLNLDYPSTRLSLAGLAEDVRRSVAGFAERVDLIRAYLKTHRPSNLGRVVMIGTPNNGSEVADLLKGSRLFQSVLDPAGLQLVTNQDAFRHLFEDDGYELGVIAGRNIANPIAAAIFKAPNDGKVSVASTLPPGCRDHIVIQSNHTLMALSRRTHAETATFLRNGKFSEDSDRSECIHR